MLKNLTPHAINIVLPSGSTMTIPPEGEPARCAETVEAVGEIEGVPLIRRALGSLTGLPAPEEGVYLIVSLAAAQKAWAMGRRDCLAIGETVRDAAGRVIGAKSLACMPG
jgi:hypothetical protein